MSRSTGLPVVWGYTSEDRYIIVVYEEVDDETIRVITAYESLNRGLTDMAKKKKVKRVARSGRLSAEQIAKDREVRRKIQNEFPPAPEEPIPDSLSEALKRAIQESGRTVYQIAKEAHVSQIMISRFLSGERDIRMATADKLANALGLKLAPSS